MADPTEHAQAGGGVAVHQLAIELHDGLSQELFAAELDLHELRSRADLPPDVREIVDRIDERLRSGSRQLRSALIGVLAPAVPSAPGRTVPVELEALAGRFRDRYGICPEVSISGAGERIADEAARILCRAVQEGLANVGKHALAGRVTVRLCRGRRSWAVRIADDGIGDPARARSSALACRSFGLSSLAAEVARVGGRFSIGSDPSLGGLLLEVAVPAT